MSKKDKDQGCFIGQWHDGAGNPFVATNPATGSVIWSGNAASLEQVSQAVYHAQDALREWRARPIDERIEYLRSFQDHVKKNSDALAKAIATDTGKPLWDTKTEVNAMVQKVSISIEANSDRCSETEQTLAQQTLWTRHKPHGVVGILGPFNFPCHLPNGHIIPALLAGNTVVFKPSELTPLAADQMMRIWENVSLPPGVLNMVQGGHDVGEALALHPKLNALFFTGSTKTGAALSTTYSDLPGRLLALEMGGNNPLIIGQVKNIQAAALITIQSAFISSGQRCTCARRLIVIQNDQSKAFLTQLISMTQKIRIGAFTESPEPFMGPLITEKAVQSLIDHQATLIQEGANPLLQMKQTGPCFVTPGIIDVTTLPLGDDEHFGPLLQVHHVKTLDGAIRAANDTRFGLSAAILSDHRDDYDQCLDRLEAGIINWNCPTTGASSRAPFGGIGASGNFRPSAYYAADYCTYPVASMESKTLALPTTLPPGITTED